VHKRMQWVLAAGLVLVGAGSAPGGDNPRVILERAVKAHGGEERLARLHADRVQIKGTILVEGRDVPFVGETLVQLPSQFKNVLQLDEGKRKRQVVQIVNGDQTWVTIDNQPLKLPDNALAEMRETLYLERAVRLVPLLKDKTFSLEAAAEAKVKDRPCAVIKVSSKGRRDLWMYFDKETGLLIKTEHPLVGGDGKEVKQEEYYADFKEIQGYKRPAKVTAYRDGKKVMEAVLTEVKYLDKIDEREFAKP
jgi:hypothetical protein